ncbi:hypothetical protein IE53DRAFT_163476 [Violaceomyces palustris]|uniref:Uncharacterized protein n=1 Tax=Violaceomyces palustris TaxID=1673888 RepID=A0ACD0NTG6_9BASI|nr:hypothetical protein IE53DRAFT_163476 [Violaceomyces palustris]
MDCDGQPISRCLTRGPAVALEGGPVQNASCEAHPRVAVGSRTSSEISWDGVAASRPKKSLPRRSSSERGQRPISATSSAGTSAVALRPTRVDSAVVLRSERFTDLDPDSEEPTQAPSEGRNTEMLHGSSTNPRDVGPTRDVCRPFVEKKDETLVSTFKFKDLPVSLRQDPEGFLEPLLAVQMDFSSGASQLGRQVKYSAQIDSSGDYVETGCLPGTSHAVFSGSYGSDREGCAEDDDGICSDGGHADFAWLEDTANKKKRKSTRSSANHDLDGALFEDTCIHSRSYISTGTAGDRGKHSLGGGTDGDADTEGPTGGGGDDIDERDLPRLILPKPRIPYSSQRRTQLKLRIKTKYKLMWAARARRRSQEDADGESRESKARTKKAQEEAEAAHASQQASVASGEKKSTKRLTKAEKRAQALRGSTRGPKVTSLASIKARAAGQAPQGTSVAVPSKKAETVRNGVRAASNQTSFETTNEVEEVRSTLETTRIDGESAGDQTSTPPPASKLKVPSGAFTFSCASPIFERIKKETKLLQAKLAERCRPIDKAVAAAAEALERLEGGDDSSVVSATAALNAAKNALELGFGDQIHRYAASNTNTEQLIGSLKSQSSGGASPVNTQRTGVMERSSLGNGGGENSASVREGGKWRSGSSDSLHPPLHPPSPKLSRRKKANMNNVHHRANYIPSRIPSDGPAPLRGGKKGRVGHHDDSIRPGLDHPTTTCGLFDGEWLCPFCEYELLYGEPPLMFKACRRRKKVVNTRKRAQERAKKAASGGGLSSHAHGHHTNHQHRHGHADHHHDHHHHHHHHHNHHHPHGLDDEDDCCSSHHDAHVEEEDEAGGRAGATLGSSRRSAGIKGGYSRERCSCGNPIHDSDDQSDYSLPKPRSRSDSSYRRSSSSPKMPMMDSTAVNICGDSKEEGQEERVSQTAATPCAKITEIAAAAAAAAAPTTDLLVEGPTTNAPPLSKASTSPPPPPPSSKNKKPWETSQYAAALEAMAKDTSHLTAIARYIASGGRTTPPPILLAAVGASPMP